MNWKKEIELVNISRSSREQFAAFFSHEQQSIKDLITYCENHPVYITKCAWTLELVALNHPEWISPYTAWILDQLDTCDVSAMRCFMHTLLTLLRANDKKTFTLLEKATDRFEMYLYDDSSVAVKSYSIYILYYLGFNQTTAHSVLLDYLTNHPTHEKPAIRMAAKKTYQALQTSLERKRKL